MAVTRPLTLQPPRSRWRRALAAVVLIAAGLLAWYWATLREDALAGAAYGARIGCSCRYVEGRDLASCKADFEPGMGLVMLSEDDATKSVTARFPLLARQAATFRAGEGCVLEPWTD